MVRESNQNVFLIQIDASSFAEFEYPSSRYRDSTVPVNFSILFLNSDVSRTSTRLMWKTGVNKNSKPKAVNKACKHHGDSWRLISYGIYLCVCVYMYRLYYHEQRQTILPWTKTWLEEILDALSFIKMCKKVSAIT